MWNGLVTATTCMYITINCNLQGIVFGIRADKCRSRAISPGIIICIFRTVIYEAINFHNIANNEDSNFNFHSQDTETNQ